MGDPMSMFNTEPAVQEFERLQNLYGFKTCFETGTHRGFGTLAALKFVDVVVTSEVNPESWEFSCKAFLAAGFKPEHAVGSVSRVRSMIFSKAEKVIHAYNGSSEKMLSSCDETDDLCVCFYLDAHWQDYWPLRDELKAIRDHRDGKDVIIIHDCRVPQSVLPGNQLTYCAYGGKDCDYEYVKDLLLQINPKYQIAYNLNGGPVGIMYCLPPL